MTISNYHRRQYRRPYESTLALLDFMQECIGQFDGLRILDAACGAGANVLHMLRRWPHAHITGVDLKPEAISYARWHIPKKFLQRTLFRVGDILALPEYFAPHEFDVTTLMQTLLLFDRETYPRVLESIFAVTRSWVFLSSLFTEYEMDVESRIHLHVASDEYPSGNVSYNTLAVSRFARVCKSLGARKVLWRDFDISVNLEPPTAKGLGTYTVSLANGKRLQFSGCVFMPWKFVGIQMGRSSR